MPTLHITRGLPASGKSTLARTWVAEDPAHRAEVNRDHLRAMMHGGFANAEPQITAASHAAILALLRRGTDVICSDTNLPQRVARELATLARQAGADVIVHDLTDVPVDTCIARDAARDKPVGEEPIRNMWNRYLKGKTHPLPLPEARPDRTADLTPYTPKPDAPKTVLVDIDGTVALMNGRSPYDETRVHEDLPNEPVIALVKDLQKQGHYVVFMSGRTGGCMDVTADWLDQQGFSNYDLYMRPIGDQRRDAVVKQELFDAHVRDRFDVRLVLDDRDQVVRMWRALGLTCLQVAEGDF